MRDFEHQEQVALFVWASYQENSNPELSLMFAIPNGGQRNVIVAKKLKDEGVKAGVPDIFLPIARGKYHGLFIEMKYGKNKPNQNQKDWIESLRKQGYKVEVVYSFEEAKEVILNYLLLKNKGG